MTKTFVDTVIRNMKMADVVTKVTPWMMEGFGDKGMNVRFVGIKLTDEWLDIFSEKNNLLMKFIFDKNTAYIEYYLANSTPFTKITSSSFTQQDKWEILLGELRRKLKKDKADVVHHTEKVGNLYAKIQGKIK